jgi:hypothetical protein
MKLKSYIAACLFAFTITAYAIEPLPSNLISFTSPTGLALFKKDLNPNALKLLAHFTTQKTVTYCGIASVVMILNASTPLDLQRTPYRYFNQDDFFNEQVKKIITLDEVKKQGINLTKLSKVIQSYGLKAQPIFANTLNMKKFREILKGAILQQQFIIVNFLRSELHQQGGGHHSPLVAYDKNTDRFLLLDVARYKYPAYWVKTAELWKAIDTVDDRTYRGLIIISAPE